MKRGRRRRLEAAKTMAVAVVGFWSGTRTKKLMTIFSTFNSTSSPVSGQQQRKTAAVAWRVKWKYFILFSSLVAIEFESFSVQYFFDFYSSFASSLHHHHCCHHLSPGLFATLKHLIVRPSAENVTWLLNFFLWLLQHPAWSFISFEPKSGLK